MGYDNHVYLAKLAEQAERYEGISLSNSSRFRDFWPAWAEMVENMKNVASADQELSVEERNLLSVAYKNVIGARRASWRIVTSIEQKEESKGNESQVGLIKEYRQKIEAELAKICEDILEVLDEHLIKSAQSGESKVFYHKMYILHTSRFTFRRFVKADSPTGKVTITVTSPNLHSETSARFQPTNLWMPTSQQQRWRLPILRLRIPSVLVWLWTFQCSTTRFSILLIKLVILPNRHLMMPLLVSNQHIRAF